jgi:hypothetical protein
VKEARVIEGGKWVYIQKQKETRKNINRKFRRVSTEICKKISKEKRASTPNGKRSAIGEEWA